ncbi:MAG: flagellar biosynthesis protein FlhB [Candidatus Margulisbacteria bacterium]|nr:flagellar biosynthesis protein FlhB [Candidatus Margulisiibacteriota bacterium]MBU1021186.1 flagellar biosynthesis protein FlhB [Candidatus Margulisiibacteriota bacterium]MBU1729792.1 flagellar biosynthesis protein FlhB [Candidatus Margulisiibacteriota bacterium]MBU1955293.1 flagellar biosynthesis protein FlhB [Candidatus Margulisiibacteriota bacterium]
MGEQGGDKTEDPTPHRLREAREKGQIAKSKEITTAFLLIISFAFFRYIGPFMFKQLYTTVRAILYQIPNAHEFSLAFAGYILLIAAQGFAYTVLPIFAVVFLAAILAEAFQTGLVFAVDPLSPKIERISPFEGFKRMFSIQGFVETIKSILKIVIVFYISWSVIADELPSVIVLVNSQAWDALATGGGIAYKIAMRVGIFYIFIALLDYLFRRWEYMRNLKMTKQEVKEEYKRLEGDPMVKQRMRDMQRQAAYQRMMGAVPQADVVVTNPTHLACALKYDAAKMKAPALLAKGERKIAEEIRRIAEEHEIPIVENEPLARTIFRTTKIKQEVPPELYQAIAEVLAYVYKIKKDRKDRSRRVPLMPVG